MISGYVRGPVSLATIPYEPLVGSTHLCSAYLRIHSVQNIGRCLFWLSAVGSKDVVYLEDCFQLVIRKDQVCDMPFRIRNIVDLVIKACDDAEIMTRTSHTPVEIRMRCIRDCNH